MPVSCKLQAKPSTDPPSGAFPRCRRTRLHPPPACSHDARFPEDQPGRSGCCVDTSSPSRRDVRARSINPVGLDGAWTHRPLPAETSAPGRSRRICRARVTCAPIETYADVEAFFSKERVIGLTYQRYGISEELVQRVKAKMKNPAVKERIKLLVKGLTKRDLQDRAKVRRLVGRAAAILNENLTGRETDNIVNFVIAQRIDPNNTFHLIKLWGMFR